MTDDRPEPNQSGLQRDINSIGSNGYAVARAKGTPHLDEVVRRLRWQARAGGDATVGLLRAGLGRLEQSPERNVPPELMLNYWEVDADEPRHRDDRLRSLTSSLSAEFPMKSRDRRKEEAVRTEFRLPTERALAAELLTMLEESGASPRLIDVDEETRQGLTALVTAAALQLIVECNDHGAWPGSPGESGPRLSLSVSCWAAAALSKVFGEPVRPWVVSTEKCVRRSYSTYHGAIGANVLHMADTPPFQDRKEFHPFPRLTGSAVKIIHLKYGRATTAIGRCIGYLLKSGERGYWNEHSDPGEEHGNVLTSAYVLDALLRMEDEQVPEQLLRDGFELGDETEEIIETQFESRIEGGLLWVADQQDPRSGAWPEEPDGTPSPYAAAHVVGFLWQLLARRERTLTRTLEYLEKTQRDGGYPEVDGGDPEIAPTAMIVNGLLRIRTPAVASLAERGLGFLGGFAAPDELPRLGAFAATFVLLLGMTQYEEHQLLAPGWREPVVKAIEAYAAARTRSTTPEQLADATVAPLGDALGARVRPALLEILSEPAADHA